MFRPRAAGKWLVPTAAVLLAALGLLALRAFPGLAPSRMVARYWWRELARLPDEQVLFQLRRIARLGDAGIPVLVEALGSRRASVRHAAGRVLREQMDRWETLPTGRAGPKIALLAEHLADRVSTFDAPSRVVAADLATRILLWPVDRQTVNSVRLIAHCETILRAAGTDSRSTLARRLEARKRPTEPGGLPSSDATLGAPASAGASGPPRDAPSGSATGDLPEEMLKIRPLEPPPSEAVPPENAPPLDSAGAEAADAPNRPQPFSPPSSRPLPSPSAAGAGSERSSDAGPVPGSTGAGDKPGRAGPPLERLDALQVMGDLHSADAQIAAAAADELTRRGFNADALRLARRLTDPDPQVRRRLAGLLPRISGVDPRPWLLWLTRDADPAVRREAVSILATSRDPKIQQKLREMAERETDASVLRSLPRR